MNSIWPQLEGLLDRVQKPARYIGCEGGAWVADHDPRKVAWLLTYPDTYEVGLPNQGLQILYEILNERDDAVAERSYAPWLDLDDGYGAYLVIEADFALGQRLAEQLYDVIEAAVTGS